MKKSSWKKLGEKYALIIELKKEGKKHGINLDIEIYDEKTILSSYSSNRTLIYQLNDKKTIYGALKVPKRREIQKIELRMKADYSIIDDDETGIEIYRAIRNLWLIKSVMNGVVDNMKLNKTIEDELGKNRVLRLKSGKDLKTDRTISMIYLNDLLKKVLKKLDEARWEKIAL